MSDPRLPSSPRRRVALGLALLGCGLGHFYAGLPRRALGWCCWTFAGLLALAAALPSLGSAIGWRAAFFVFVVFGLTAWAGPMVDLARLRMRDLVARPVWQVVLLWLGLLLAASAVRHIVRVFLVEAFKVPTGSMTPTVLLGDHILVDKRVYRTRAPRRGEVMVFASPERPEVDFVKRVIALPGDKLEMKEGHPFLNGWAVPHCKAGSFTFPAEGDDAASTGDVEVEFLDGHAYLTFYDADGESFTRSQGPYEVDANEAWVLGDNRNKSADSRTWYGGEGGGVPRRLVKGRALFTWLNTSKDHLDVSRTGVSLTQPQLPAAMQALEAAFAHCLETAPPYDQTVPPKP